MVGILPSGLPNHGLGRKMLSLGAKMDLGAHLGHVSMLFEPYKSIGVEIKSIGDSQSPFLSLLLFFSPYEITGYMT